MWLTNINLKFLLKNILNRSNNFILVDIFESDVSIKYSTMTWSVQPKGLWVLEQFPRNFCFGFLQIYDLNTKGNGLVEDLKTIVQKKKINFLFLPYSTQEEIFSLGEGGICTFKVPWGSTFHNYLMFFALESKLKI